MHQIYINASSDLDTLPHNDAVVDSLTYWG